MVINEFIICIYGVMLLAAKRRLMMVEYIACLCCLGAGRTFLLTGRRTNSELKAQGENDLGQWLLRLPLVASIHIL